MSVIKANWIKIVAILLLCVIILFALYDNAKNSSTFPSPAYGIPVVSNSEIDTSRSSIDQIASSETQLFILYDESQGIVKTYDLHGNYQQTLLFYAHQNGAFRIAVVEDVLYVRDKYSNVYIFGNNSFSAFKEREDALQILEDIDFERQSHRFEVRAGSVWDGKDNVCIIERPAYSSFYQNNFDFIVSIFVVIFFILYRIYSKKGHE